MICDNISVENGCLFFAGMNTVDLAHEYGTPLYLMDEDKIREKCRIYKTAFDKYFPEGSMPLFASKANSFVRMIQIANEEGLGIDVVSSGEIYTAVKAGFPLEKAFFHGNNKTDHDIAFAMDHAIGTFVADGKDELLAINAEAGRRGIVQKVLLRITPGIDTHTYEAVNTGLVDSKFGSAIETGQADEITRLALSLSGIYVAGFHCHVGSQVFDEDVFERSAAIMIDFAADMREKYGFLCEELNLGGGYGVPYTDSDRSIDISEKLRSVADTVNSCCLRRGITVPRIFMEPGRSIVADAGMTLYTAGSVKDIPGYKSYVSVDGGMGDNPRYALYRSAYTVFDASRAGEAADKVCDIAGRCCESGDIIQPSVKLPSSVRRGDIIAVCTTGAYNYSMASNYNKLPRPAMVMLSGGRSYTAVRRESLEDLIKNEL